VLKARIHLRANISDELSDYESGYCCVVQSGERFGGRHCIIHELVRVREGFVAV
jgi:hypothetical protein